ncbi:TnsA endonuclease N-terminal domain-containing protein [Kistimonas scapharcae]|uniref:TnsA endonuclease N-terminal domain-containing protein n=1 Tax=Kistimonas scapharcae TaxID=1036133 RepID=A0ABP8V2C0_9GAMM
MSDAEKPLNKKDKNRLKDGRGTGNGVDYVAFIRVGEFDSSGESVRVKSTSVGRVHHFHSGIELAAFLIFDRNRTTVDIREQYPIPLDDTLNICRQLGIRHPQTKGELHIVSTDLLIDLRGGKQIAIAVKNAKDLDDERILEKLQIEKAYWEGTGVNWYVFTEREVSAALKANLKWLKPFLDIDTQKAYSLTEDDAYSLISRIQQYPNNLVTKLCGRLDDEYQVEPGFHIEALRFSVALGYIEAPIDKHFTEWVCAELIDSVGGIARRGSSYAS